jgi:transcriptional regulator with XRE-family HTH domain
MKSDNKAVQLGRVIRELREASGKTLSEFADAIEMDRNSYVAIERGQKRLMLRTLQRIAGVVGVRMSAILRRVEPE